MRAILENYPGGPPDLIARFTKAAHVALADPTVKAKLEDLGARAIPSTPEEMRQMQQSELDRYGMIVKAKNIKVE